MDNITCGSTNSGMSFHNKMELASELNQADTDNYIVIDPKSDIIIQEAPIGSCHRGTVVSFLGSTSISSSGIFSGDS